MNEPILYCADFPDVKCCDSCHTCHVNGYNDVSTVELVNGQVVIGCCAVLAAIPEASIA